MKGIENVESLQKKSEINGVCDERFDAVREAFAQTLDTGQDVGASVAVSVEGEAVVDLWGGYFDTTYTRLFVRSANLVEAAYRAIRS